MEASLTERLDEVRKRENEDSITTGVLRICPELIAEALTRMLVAVACEHDYYDPAPEALLEDLQWEEGLTMSVGVSANQHGEKKKADTAAQHVKSSSSLLVYYQAVDMQSLSQWLACHLSSAKECTFILQNACLSCTLMLARSLDLNNKGLNHGHICIIAGNPPIGTL
jgi:hypothetical protein